MPLDCHWIHMRMIRGAPMGIGVAFGGAYGKSTGCPKKEYKDIGREGNEK